MKILSLVLALFAFFFVFTNNVTARPSNRIKRFSDQRLAEIETYLGLSKLQGKVMQVPVGFGQHDFTKIGRKRRSDTKFLANLFKTDEEPDPKEFNYEYIYKKR